MEPGAHPACRRARLPEDTSPRQRLWTAPRADPSQGSVATECCTRHLLVTEGRLLLRLSLQKGARAEAEMGAWHVHQPHTTAHGEGPSSRRTEPTPWGVEKSRERYLHDSQVFGNEPFF